MGTVQISSFRIRSLKTDKTDRLIVTFIERKCSSPTLARTVMVLNSWTSTFYVLNLFLVNCNAQKSI